MPQLAAVSAQFIAARIQRRLWRNALNARYLFARGGKFMFDSFRDLALYAAAGAVGGFIYWSMRHHGQVWVDLARQLLPRR
ncbi:hypothetical protein [Terricaulis sp.]|uniref:hypothetical protein n=1 Tax=Terricaulis sp. TaxID=2768686 RepID=UPI002AC587A7|nr:hypothetical protein [Terricaulis sp.]MDZ4690241.1 hypothetical protein [Terricaulis sp.]